MKEFNLNNYCRVKTPGKIKREKGLIWNKGLLSKASTGIFLEIQARGGWIPNDYSSVILSSRDFDESQLLKPFEQFSFFIIFYSNGTAVQKREYAPAFQPGEKFSRHSERPGWQINEIPFFLSGKYSTANYLNPRVSHFLLLPDSFLST